MSSGLRAWDFWTKVSGTVYGFRGHHPVHKRVRYLYGGKTHRRDWRKRIAEHLFGTDTAPPKPWADTVLGYRPGCTVDDVIGAGGAFVIWRRERTTPLALTLAEVWLGIWLRWPLYNVQWNLSNPRRIPPWDATQQRAERDRAMRRAPGRPATGAQLVAGWRARSGRVATALGRVVLGLVLAVAGVAVLALAWQHGGMNP